MPDSPQMKLERFSWVGKLQFAWKDPPMQLELWLVGRWVPLLQMALQWQK